MVRKDWVLSWRDYENLSLKLERQVRKSKFKPDFVVCISRGGLVVGRLLSGYLNTPLAVVTAKSYSGRKRKRLRLNLHFSTLTPVKGKVLLVDDVADSGETLRVVSSRLRKNKQIKELKTAAVVEKSFSKFKPDFIAAKYDGWIVFPYEKRG
ncbi:MAG: phosphoribosyltransferase family protein [Candidatus Norongarragalinales archaeon]